MQAANTHLTAWVTEKFISAAPVAAAKAVGALATVEAVQLLRPLKAQHIISCLNVMDVTRAAAILRRLPARQGAYILARLNLPQGGAVYAALSVPHREKLKTMLSARQVRSLESCSRWAPGSAGACMSTDFLAFTTESRLSEIVEKLKTMPRRKLPAACFITAKDGSPKGFIRMAELAFYPSSSAAGTVMTPAQTVSVKDAVSTAQTVLAQGQPLAAVVDEEGALVGVLDAGMIAAAPKRKKWLGWF